MARAIIILIIMTTIYFSYYFYSLARSWHQSKSSTPPACPALCCTDPGPTPLAHHPPGSWAPAQPARHRSLVVRSQLCLNAPAVLLHRPHQLRPRKPRLLQHLHKDLGRCRRCGSTHPRRREQGIDGRGLQDRHAKRQRRAQREIRRVVELQLRQLRRPDLRPHRRHQLTHRSMSCEVIRALSIRHGIHRDDRRADVAEQPSHQHRHILDLHPRPGERQHVVAQAPGIPRRTRARRNRSRTSAGAGDRPPTAGTAGCARGVPPRAPRDGGRAVKPRGKERNVTSTKCRRSWPQNIWPSRSSPAPGTKNEGTPMVRVDGLARDTVQGLVDVGPPQRRPRQCPGWRARAQPRAGERDPRRLHPRPSTGDTVDA